MSDINNTNIHLDTEWLHFELWINMMPDEIARFSFKSIFPGCVWEEDITEKYHVTFSL